MDSYRNLTLKTLTILHWTLTHCPQATWLVKSDEDVFINPIALKNVLQQAVAGGANFVCRVQHTPTVCRKNNNLCRRKWVVSVNEYQNVTYPTHCTGAAYAVSADMLEKLYTAANKTHPYFLEDVYFTGILAHGYRPLYVDVRPRFKVGTSKFREMFWNGTVLFGMFHWRIRNATSYALWDRIMEYNNVTSLLVSP